MGTAVAIHFGSRQNEGTGLWEEQKREVSVRSGSCVSYPSTIQDADPLTFFFFHLLSFILSYFSPLTF